MALNGTATVSPRDTRGSVQEKVKLPPPFHGLHVAPLQMAHEKIAWNEPMRRCTRVRVRRHTCECKATIYELCMSGGLMFIRRTVRGPDGLDVHETEWLLSARAAVLWQRLLLGQAR